MIARLVGAGVLFAAAISKAGDPQGGVLAVRAYRILPEALVHPVAYALPAFEIALAVLLVLGVATRLVGTIAASTIVVFMVAIISAAARGLRIDCGCFGGGGDVEQTQYLLEIGRDLLILAVLLVVVFSTRSRLSVDEWVRGRGALKPLRPAAGSSARRRRAAELRAAEARRQQRRRGTAVKAVAVTGIVAAVLGGIAVNSAASSKPSVVVAPAGATAAGGIVVGDATAPLKLIAYEDPQCPVCRDFEQVNGATLKQAIDEGSVSVEYRMRSFLGPESVRAVNALAAAQDEGKFEALREALFANQPPERSGGFTTDDLLALGRSVGLDSAAYAGAVRSMKYGAWVERIDDQASRDGNTGTPQLVRVGGEPLTLRQTLDPVEFKAALGLR